MKWGVVGLWLLLVPCHVGAQSGLMVTAQAGQLTLTWQEGVGEPEAGFRVSRSLPGDVCLFTPVADVAADTLTFVDAPLPEGERWCYRVTAFSAAGESPPSNVACGTVPGGAPPGGQVAEQLFTRTTQATTVFNLPVPGTPYLCQRQAGGTTRVFVYRSGVRLTPDVKVPQLATGATFLMRCEVTPAAILLSLDGVLTLTVLP